MHHRIEYSAVQEEYGSLPGLYSRWPRISRKSHRTPTPRGLHHAFPLSLSQSSSLRQCALQRPGGQRRSREAPKSRSHTGSRNATRAVRACASRSFVRNEVTIGHLTICAAIDRVEISGSQQRNNDNDVERARPRLARPPNICDLRVKALKISHRQVL